MIINDQELVARVILSDDHYAFQQLVNKYQSPLRLFLRRMVKNDEAIADDIAQESFLLAYRKIDQFEGRSSFATWLYCIAKNQFLQYKRKKKESFSWEGPCPEEQESGEIIRNMDIEAAIKLLRPIERAALTMCYFEELTHEDVCLILDIPLGTLKTHVRRAKERLKKELGPYKKDY